VAEVVVGHTVTYELVVGVGVGGREGGLWGGGVLLVVGGLGEVGGVGGVGEGRGSVG